MSVKTSCSKVQTSKEFEGITFDLDFLEDAIYELICRMLHFERFILSNQLIKLMALQFQAVLQLESYSATQEWITEFRKKYNLSLYTDINIGYRECKSIQICDIIRELLHARENNKILKKDEPIEATDAKENPFTITPNTKMTRAVCTTTTNVLQKPNSKIVDIKEELPRSVYTVFGASAFAKSHEESLKPVYRDIYDIKDFLPAAVCSMPQQEQQQGNISQNVKNEIGLDQYKIGADILLSPQINLAGEAVPHNQATIRPVQIIPISTPTPLNCHAKPAFALTEQQQDVLSKNGILKALLSKPLETTKKSYATLNNPQNLKVKGKTTKFSQSVALQTQEEALRYIKLLEEFAMIKENFRLIGFVERLELLIKKH